MHTYLPAVLEKVYILKLTILATQYDNNKVDNNMAIITRTWCSKSKIDTHTHVCISKYCSNISFTAVLHSWLDALVKKN